MKIFFSPDIIFCGWVSLKHQLTSDYLLILQVDTYFCLSVNNLALAVDMFKNQISQVLKELIFTVRTQRNTVIFARERWGGERESPVNHTESRDRKREKESLGRSSVTRSFFLPLCRSYLEYHPSSLIPLMHQKPYGGLGDFPFSETRSFLLWMYVRPWTCESVIRRLRTRN